MKKTYLYGASVQGIQDFIFQTNELKDIAGASELVHRISSAEFAAMLKEAGVNLPLDSIDSDSNAILNTAGNIKYFFEDEKQCQKVVREFPQRVLRMAPGITISQAVVTCESDSDFPEQVAKLENRLRIQRNKPFKSTNLGLIGIKRAPKTGLPATKHDNKTDELLDKATEAKRDKTKKGGKNVTFELSKKCFGIKDLDHERIAYDIGKITDKNNWIAVIHIDGNGLGQIIQKMGKSKRRFKEFSQKLDQATIASAQAAYRAVEELFVNRSDVSAPIPIRPIVLGGDDHTLICRANLAIEYTAQFLQSFEKETKASILPLLETEGFKFDHLTACAGIAFIKSSYPFHYGAHLAEILCTRAKKDSKKEAHLKNELPLSSLMFHKVQDSFIEDFDLIAQRELAPNAKSSFEFGPYYLDNAPKNRWEISTLIDQMKRLDNEEGNKAKSHLRQWMGLMHENIHLAEQKKQRVVSMIGNKDLRELFKNVTDGTPREGKNYYPAYDLLALHSITTQETNK